ncbi:putative esterase [Crocosphaera watsonii WH 0402]|uniref:Putative esterase n=1 Tax=Crocosphaera watsonii WH 0402 TaxID=1284629 RepID=T2JJK5_CROWT|nr:putative esterase [Crocosphaera watsonii WH 0402]
MNYKYQITIVWSQEDECYLAYLPDFADEIMQPVTHGDTYESALKKWFGSNGRINFTVSSRK